MRHIVGRKSEHRRLDRCMASEQAQFIAVYGRRRVGKTFLISQYFDGRFDFMVTGVYKASRDEQIRLFTDELSGHTGISYTNVSDWYDAFRVLREYLIKLSADEKRVVFFDELPWFDTAKSGFLSALEWFWNGWGATQNNLVLIVCGSATSWMKENIEENKGGLYNRLTCRIYLQPFTLHETETFLNSMGIVWSRYDILQCYMIMGGIPYYLRLLDSELSLYANIDNIFFRKRAELWDEFSNLYRTLFSNSEQMVSIVEALSTKRSGLCRSEIAKMTNLAENGTLTRMLNDLAYSGFIRINDFYGKKKKLYQLSDYYTQFYFRFIKDRNGRDEHFWTNTVDNPAKNAWMGLTFEQVCRDHVDQIKKKLGISGVLSEESSWYTLADEEKGISGAQIDMLIDRRDHVINICEIKYSGGEYIIDKDYDRILKNKIDTFIKATSCRKSVTLTLISTYGVKQGKYSSIVRNQVIADDLFEE